MVTSSTRRNAAGSSASSLASGNTEGKSTGQVKSPAQEAENIFRNLFLPCLKTNVWYSLPTKDSDSSKHSVLRYIPNLKFEEYLILMRKIGFMKMKGDMYIRDTDRIEQCKITMNDLFELDITRFMGSSRALFVRKLGTEGTDARKRTPHDDLEVHREGKVVAFESNAKLLVSRLTRFVKKVAESSSSESSSQDYDGQQTEPTGLTVAIPEGEPARITLDTPISSLGTPMSSDESEGESTKTNANAGTTTTHVPNTHELVFKTYLAKLKKSHILITALQKKLKYKQYSSHSPRAQRELAAFAADHPTLAPGVLSHIIVLARYTLLLDVEYIANDIGVKEDNLEPDFFDESVANLDQVWACSPTSRATIRSLVANLASERATIERFKMAKASAVHYHQDAAPTGEIVEAISYLDADDTSFSPDGTVKKIYVACNKAGKKGSDAAENADKTMTRFFGSKYLQFFDTTVDAGGGTPESMFEALQNVGRIDELRGNAGGMSCGCHDAQSCFRLPTKLMIGEGGLEKRDALQLLHAIWDLRKAFEDNAKGSWALLLSGCWKKMHPDTAAPKELVESLQEILMTRWWTVGMAAGWAIEFWDVVVQACATLNKTSDGKIKRIADGLLSLMREGLLHAHVHFISAFVRSILDPMMIFYGKTDPNVGMAGHLCVHRALRFFYDQQKVRSLLQSKDQWKHEVKFKKFVDYVEENLPADTHHGKLVEELPFKFFELVADRLQYHNKRYIMPHHIIPAAFGEQRFGRVVACCLLGLPRPTMVDRHVKSTILDDTVDLVAYDLFIREWADKEIEKVQTLPLFGVFESTLKYVARGGDIWDKEREDETSRRHRRMVLAYFGPAASSGQFIERGVKKLAYILKTGMSAQMANAYLMASNGFDNIEVDLTTDLASDSDDESSTEEGVSSESDDEQDDTPSSKRKRRRKQITGLNFLSSVIVNRCTEIEGELADLIAAEGLERVKECILSIKGSYKDKATFVEAERCKDQVDMFMLGYGEDVRENARTMASGVDLTPQAEGMIRLSDLRAKIHRQALIDEIRARHITPYYPISKACNEKRSHPIFQKPVMPHGGVEALQVAPKTKSRTMSEQWEKEGRTVMTIEELKAKWMDIEGLDKYEDLTQKVTYKRLEDMPFQALKDLLMADEECYFARRQSVYGNDGRALAESQVRQMFETFNTKAFWVRGVDVNFEL